MIRGAGESEGKTSWSSKAECTDYASVAGLFIQYLALLQLGDSNMASNTTAIDLIIAGYSYGSMIATNCPPVPSILAPFGSASPSKASIEISLRAQHLAAQTNQEIREIRHATLVVPSDSTRKSFEHTVSIGGDEAPALASPNSKDHGTTRNIRQSLDNVSRKFYLRKSNDAKVDEVPKQNKDNHLHLSTYLDSPINTYYLLVSPLLPPVATLTALPFSSQDNSQHMKKLATNPTLAVYGEEDGFTSSKKLNAWGIEISKSNPRFQGIEVDCAGHFWREPGVAQELVEHIGNWISTLTGSDSKL
jgi:pimeloyl-ACP methyl ester carboxylesterase